jgi:hypothetical protein
MFPLSLDCRSSRHGQCGHFDTTEEGRRYCGCECHPGVSAAEYRLSVQHKREIAKLNADYPGFTEEERATFKHN